MGPPRSRGTCRARRLGGLAPVRTSGPHQEVDGLAGSLGRVDVPADLTGLLDDEAVPVDRREHLRDGREERRVGRTAVAVVEVVALVRDDEERPARADERRGVSERAGERLGGQLQVADEHEVGRLELRRGGHVGEGRDQLDVAGSRDGRGLLERDGRELDELGLPALLREPDGVAPLAAGEVQRTTRPDPVEMRRDLLDDERVGSRGPDELARGVPLVPGGGVDVSPSRYGRCRCGAARRRSGCARRHRTRAHGPRRRHGRVP